MKSHNQYFFLLYIINYLDIKYGNNNHNSDNSKRLRREKLVGHLSNDMESNNRENETKSHDHNDDRINTQSRGFISVKLKHGV